MNRYHKSNGFTLVELMLAMGFVSALLLAIAMTVIQIGNIYNRGIAYKDITQSGDAIASDLQRSISTSPPFDLTTDIVTGEGPNYVIKPFGGRLCTGKYSYVWNYGKAIKLLTLGRYKYASAGAPSPTPEVNFVKIIDTAMDYCTIPTKPVVYSNAVELLKTDNNNLAIHKFTIGPVSPSGVYDSKTGQRLYSIEFYIGTNDKPTLNATQTSCLPPSDSNSDPVYCVVNKFNITARAGKKTE